MKVSRIYDLIIIGGGIIGVSVAERLAQEGLRIAVLEEASIAAGASGAAAGMLAPLGEAQVGGAGRPGEAGRLGGAGRSDGPGRSEGRSLDPGLELGMRSLALFEGLCARLKEEVGIDPEFERSGLLEVAFDEAELRRFDEKIALAEECACSWPFDPQLQRLDAAAIHSAEPSLASGALGGLFSPHEGHLRPPLLARALAQSARDKGVTFLTGVRAERLIRSEGTPGSAGTHRTGSRIDGVDTRMGRFASAHVVVAAGPWSSRLMEASGLAGTEPMRLSVEPIRGQILQLDAPLPETRRICWAPGIYTVPKRDGSWIVGATEEAVGFDRRVTAAGVATLLSRARGLFPELGEASFARAWAGLRPVSGDGKPWLGPWPDLEGLWLATGHGRNGVLLSAMTSQILSEAILGKSQIESRHPFSPGSEARTAVR